MHTQNLADWKHEHVFDQDRQRPGEQRTRLIVLLTATMMVIEVAAGLIFGSMALLADGLHMASHATALGIAAFAYAASRRLAADRRFSFGVGKINSLAGFASAVLLMGFAVVMTLESTGRLLKPSFIAFDQAILVAVVGLIVNGVSAWVLASTPHDHGYGHDHNLRGAYLHVLADALTSVLAIVALLGGKYLGAVWLDPAMGFVGAALVTQWSYRLIRESGRVLLDSQASEDLLTALRTAIEAGTSDRVADLHVWSIGHGIYAADIGVVSDEPKTPRDYKRMIPQSLKVAHATVEVHRCSSH